MKKLILIVLFIVLTFGYISTTEILAIPGGGCEFNPEYCFEDDPEVTPDQGGSSSNPVDIDLEDDILANIESSSDYDYFRFVPSNDTCIIFESSEINTLLDLHVEELETGSIDDNSGTSSNFKLRVVVNKFTVYTFKVGNTNSTGSYRVTLTECPDTGGQPWNPSYLSENFSSISGSLEYSGDIDFYRFSPSEMTCGYFSTTATNGVYTIAVHSQGELYKEKTTYYYDQQQKVVLNGNENHYFEIYSGQGDILSYDITFTQKPCLLATTIYSKRTIPFLLETKESVYFFYRKQDAIDFVEEQIELFESYSLLDYLSNISYHPASFSGGKLNYLDLAAAYFYDFSSNIVYTQLRISSLEDIRDQLYVSPEGTYYVSYAENDCTLGCGGDSGNVSHSEGVIFGEWNLTNGFDEIILNNGNNIESQHNIYYDDRD